MKKFDTPWLEYLENIAPLPALSKDIACNVLIVGEGITGMTTAYELSKSGKKVVVIQKGNLKDTTTAYTTAFLTSMLDTDVQDLLRMNSKANVKEIVASHEKAITYIEQTTKNDKFDCEFMRVPYYSFAKDATSLERCVEEVKARKKSGFAAETFSSGEIPFENTGGMKILHQAKFHPTKYLVGLRKKAMQNGVEFYENTTAGKIKGGEEVQKVEVEAKVGHKTFTITADQIVIATHNPYVQPWWYYFKKGEYVSYVLELSVSHGQIPEALFEDDENPYHYIRVDAGKGKDGGDRVIVGGEDHRKEIKMKDVNAYERLENYFKHILPDVEYDIVRKWDGSIYEPTDGLAIIGRYSTKYPNRFTAGGFSGNGMTYGTLAGMMISDMIEGEENEWEEIYAPSRLFSVTDLLIKGRDYVGELWNGVITGMFRKK